VTIKVRFGSVRVWFYSHL